MISRIHSRIFPTLANNTKRWFSTNNDWGKEVFNFQNERLETDEKNDIIPPEIPKIQKPSLESQYNFIVDENGYVNVFTDGACLSNGSENSKAGIGVWFGDNHPLNVSKRIFGRSTCNVAEIKAATAAARQANKVGIKKLKVNTDSKFLIMCITEWMKKWKMIGWTTAKNRPVINKEELIELENALSSLDVTWAHVLSHTGVHGNEMAHHLAKLGIDEMEAKKTQLSNRIIELSKTQL